MMDIGPFLMLLGAIWVTFVPFAPTVKALNEIRDKILSLAPTYSLEHRSLMLRNDWGPILFGAAFQQLFLAGLLYVLPSVAPVRSDFGERVGEKITWICYTLALFAVLRLLGFAFTFRRDYSAMVRYLASLSSPTTTETSRT